MVTIITEHPLITILTHPDSRDSRTVSGRTNPHIVLGTTQNHEEKKLIKIRDNGLHGKTGKL